MGTVKNKEKLEELHQEAIERYRASFDAENDEREKCLEDMKFAFVPGSQWDTNEAKNRADRPRFEINKILTPLNQMIGDQRQNRVSIKVRPLKGGATQKIGDVFTGLIRNIESQSNFKDIKDNAFKELSSGGFGAWYVTTDYTGDDTFEQDIFIRGIRSAASSVYYDPAAVDELKRDAMWIMVTEDMAKEEFKVRYPDKTCSDLTNTNTAAFNGWQTRDTVRVADYWVKEPYTQELALLSDGRVIELTTDTKSIIDELLLQGITILKKRKKPAYKVKMYKISASDILEGPFDWAGKYIPVVPIFGYNVWINGQHFYQGMVRPAKDPQRVYNYSTSQAIETSALSPKDPYWMTPTQAKGHEAQLATFNVKNSPFMFYNSDEKAPGPPARSGAPSVQQALIAQTQQADMDVQATTGQFNPSLGMNDGDQSGRAILALQRQGNASTHELSDNLHKAVEYTGKILIDLIPKIYDTERQITILGEDGTATETPINETVFDQQTGQEVIVNDLRVGAYEVTSKTGPSYASQRIEGLNFLTKLTQSSEMFGQIATDLIAESVDFPFAGELTKRVRKVMISQGLVEATPEEQEIMAQKQPQPTPIEIMNFQMAQLKLSEQAAIVDNIKLQNNKVAADIEKTVSSTQAQLVDTETKMAEQAARFEELSLDNEKLRADINKIMGQTQESLNKALLTKTEVNANLQEQCDPAYVPITPNDVLPSVQNAEKMVDGYDKEANMKAEQEAQELEAKIREQFAPLPIDEVANITAQLETEMGMGPVEQQY